MTNRYYKGHLHLHSSLDRDGSMEGHLYEAKRLNLDFIWFTEHDTLLGPSSSRVTGFDFEGEDLIERTRNPRWEESFLNNVKFIESAGITLSEDKFNELREAQYKGGESFFGWERGGESEGITSHIELVNTKAYKGNQCLYMKAVADTRGPWESTSLNYVTTKSRRKEHPFLAQIALKLACFIETPMDSDGRIIIKVDLSQRPPHHKKGSLLYVIGDRDGLEASNRAVIALDAEGGKWEELTLNVSEDAKKHPDTGGADNVITGFSLILQARNKKNISCYFDDYRIFSELETSPELAYEPMRQRQKREGEAIAKRYGVKVFVGNEITGAGGHKNSYSTHVPVINYKNLTAGIDYTQAVEHVKKHGGIISTNHPFAPWNFASITGPDQEKVYNFMARELLDTKCYGTHMLEVGFPEGRYGYSLQYHLRLWDQLSLNGIFVTGYGCSDSHFNHEDWRDGNNFTVWIYGEELKEENLIKSMGAGNLYTGDPVFLKGGLTFKTSEGHRMGQVVNVTKSTYTLLLNLENPLSDWEVRWIVDGKTAKTDGVEDGDYGGCLDLEITGGLHFVRTEIYNGNKRCIGLTNPIYFVSDKTVEIPENRMNP